MTVRRGLGAALGLLGVMLLGGAMLWKGSAPARASNYFVCSLEMPGVPGAVKLLSIPREAQFQVGVESFGPYSPSPMASEVLEAIPGAAVAQVIDTAGSPDTAYCWPIGDIPGDQPVCVGLDGTPGEAVDFQVSPQAALLHVSDATTPLLVTLSGESQPLPTSMEVDGPNLDIFIAGPYAWFGQGYSADHLIDELATPGSSPTLARVLPTVPPTVDFWNGSSGENFPLECADGYILRVAAPGAVYWWP